MYKFGDFHCLPLTRCASGMPHATIQSENLPYFVAIVGRDDLGTPLNSLPTYGAPSRRALRLQYDTDQQIGINFLHIIKEESL